VKARCVRVVFYFGGYNYSILLVPIMKIISGYENYSNLGNHPKSGIGSPKNHFSKIPFTRISFHENNFFKILFSQNHFPENLFPECYFCKNQYLE